MANQIPKANGSKKVQFLDFHPHQPTIPSLNRKKNERPHPYTPLTSNAVNKPAIVSTNIKGILFNPNECLTPLPKQSSDDINWQMSWIEQFDGFKRECRAKEQQLNSVIAHKTAEIGKCKLQLSELLNQKSDEIEQIELKCTAKDSIMRKKIAELKQLQSETKAKDDIVDRCVAEAQQCKLKCDELDGIVQQQLTEIERLNAVSKVKEETADRCVAEAQQYKLKCDELDGIVQEQLAEIERLRLEMKAKDEITNRCVAEAQQHKLKCDHLNSIVKQKLSEIERLQLHLDASQEHSAEGSQLDCNATKSPTNYRCSKCFKYFNKKSGLDDHLTETSCAGEKKLDFKCEICEKMFTHRGLVRHLTQFLNDKHTPRGQHAKFDTEHHQTLLNSHKSKKK